MYRSLIMALPITLALALPVFAQDRAPTDATRVAAKAATDAGHLAEAISLYEKAAAQGQASAESELARIYLEGGNGVEADYSAAMQWAKKAAGDGDSRGYLYLGQIWMKGLGVSINLDKAKVFFRKGEEAGDRKAPRYLGLIAQAQGDDAAAAEWFAKGAAAGDITSQFYLGQSYETGAGIAQDYAQAMHWYQVAAERADHVASDGMVGEAGLYARGLGVPQDLAKAKALYEQAAALGNSAAQDALTDLTSESSTN